jgi:hypothetical protein
MAELASIPAERNQLFLRGWVDAVRSTVNKDWGEHPPCHKVPEADFASNWFREQPDRSCYTILRYGSAPSTWPGAKIYGLLVSAIVTRAFLPAVPATVPAYSDTRVEAVA